MKSRMLWKDMTRNRTVTLTILLFVSVAAMLLSLAAILGVNLFGSIDRLMQDAQTPHFMQMHIGEPDMRKLEAFAEEYEGAAQFQVLNFLNIDSDQIVINGASLAGTLQDNGFCTQSGQFDFLLDLDNKPVQPADGELYAPVFYSKDGTIKPGDLIVIHGMQFTVAGFV
ncbi:MAG: ABC transporter permease, partial [Bacillota bacterium]